MTELDFFFRFANIAMLALLMLIALRDARSILSMRILVFLCLSLIALLIALSPDPEKFPYSLILIAAFVNIPNTVLLWAFVESLLNDEYRLSRWRWATIGAFCLLSLPLRLISLEWLEWSRAPIALIVNTFALGLFCHLIFIAIRGWRADLISARRKFRIIFLLGISCIGILSVLLEFVFKGSTIQQLPFAKSALMFPAILASTIWLLRIDSTNFVIDAKDPHPDLPEMSPRETELLGRLNILMTEQKLYLQPGLSIQALASDLAVSDHKIRTLINKKLGHRNFNAFINSYRVDAIKIALKDPSQAHLPILTIALNMGFNSLPPFNRAFKQFEGITPTAYRQANKVGNKNSNR